MAIFHLYSISKKWWVESRCVSFLGWHILWIVFKLLSSVLLVDYTKKSLLLILLFSSKICRWKLKIPQVLCCGISVSAKVNTFTLPPSSISVNCIICILVVHMKFAYLKPGKTYFQRWIYTFTSVPFVRLHWMYLIQYSSVYSKYQAIMNRNKTIKYVEEEEKTFWKRFGLNLFSLTAMKFLSTYWWIRTI